MNSTPDPAGDAGKPGSEKKNPPRAALLFATAFGLGYLPMAPGTWGSLAGVGVAYFLWGQLPPDIKYHEARYVLRYPHLWLLVLGFVSLGGVWAAGRVAGYLATRDPQIVVIDEVSGQLLAFSAGPALLLNPFVQGGAFNWKYYLLGFILFRVFDIWKPYPANRAESLPGGWGIMADDWVAGLYAAGCLWLARGIGV